MSNPTPGFIPPPGLQHQNNSGNQNLLRLLLLVVVIAGILVMYSITRDPSTESFSSKDGLQKKKKDALEQRNKDTYGKRRRKNVRKFAPGDKKGYDKGSYDNDYYFDDNTAVPTPAPRNRKGDDVPAGRGQAFDEKHIEEVKKMVLLGRQMKWDKNPNVHPFQDVHEDDLDHNIRRAKEGGGV
jgi:hypothetical protein